MTRAAAATLPALSEREFLGQVLELAFARIDVYVWRPRHWSEIERVLR